MTICNMQHRCAVCTTIPKHLCMDLFLFCAFIIHHSNAFCEFLQFNILHCGAFKVSIFHSFYTLHTVYERENMYQSTRFSYFVQRSFDASESNKLNTFVVATKISARFALHRSGIVWFKRRKTKGKKRKRKNKYFFKLNFLVPSLPLKLNESG